MMFDSRRFVARDLCSASALTFLATVVPFTAVGAQSAMDATPAPGVAAPVEEIVVTGSRITTTGFTAPTPVTVIDAAEIRRQAVSNIADVLNSVPSFRAQSTPATTAIFINNAGANLADLRGLGAQRTLVLVDGRRFVAGTTAGGGFAPSGAVDLNMIPTVLVQRTEVVTGGASANYGSDAVAGVVNILLDTKFSGLRGSIQQGISERGDNSEFYATLAGGTDFLGGRGHIVVGGEYVNNKGTGDCYTRTWCANGFGPVSNPTPQLNGLARQVLLSNYRSVATRGGVITAGSLRGVAFNDNGSIYQHNFGTFFGAGIFQSGGSIDPVNSFWNNFPLSAPVERYSGLAHVDYEFSDKLRGFVEGSYGHVGARTLGSQGRFVGSQITIRRDNAYLTPELAARMDAAGASSFVLNKISEDFGPQIGIVDRDTYRGAAGLSGNFGERLRWDAYYQYGQTDYHQEGNNVAITGNGTPFSGNISNATDAVDQGRFLTGVANGNIVCRATLTAPTNPFVQGCVPLNIFGQNRWNPAARAYSFGDAVQDTKLTQQVAALNLQADLFTLPGGEFSLASGFEYRVEEVAGTADAISSSLRFFTSPGAAISGPAIKVKEAYLEAAAPIVRGLPFAYSLSLNGAVRVTDYSTTGSSTTWKVGGVWEPAEFLRLRATRSRDIRAPNFFELYNPISSVFQFLADPLNGNAQTLVPSRSGGNPALNPEVADTFSAGIVLSPTRNLRLAVDYYVIKLDGAVSTLGGQVIVNRCAQGATDLCSYVTRGAGNALESVTNPFLNLNRLKTRGIDIEGSFNTSLAGGDLSVRLLGTRIFDLITTDSSGFSTDRAGMNGSPVSQPSGLPKFSGTARVNYTRSAVSGGVEVRYISPGIYDALLIGPHQKGYAPTLTNSISDNKVGGAVYFNLNAAVDVMSDGNRKVQFYGVVNNLLDRDPPNDLSSSFGPTNPVLYDVIGRTFKIGARFSY
jgi:outer membrane receptor protein involved in Fe transport